MKSYFLISTTLHGLLLTVLVVVGGLLSNPRRSYYAVDLFSAPAGGGAVSGPAVTPAPPAPKVSAPRVVPRSPRAPEEELPDQDTLRMLAKLKKKRLGLIKSQ